MDIKQDAYVAIDYRLTDDKGEVLDESSAGEPLPFIFGAGMIVPGVEKALLGKTDGYAAKLTVEPEDGYGPANDNLLHEIPRSNFPDDLDIQAGMVFQADGPHGPVNFMVSKVTDEAITADFNHPLAGKRLHFDLKVLEVREATQEDLDSLHCSPDECDSCCGGCGHDHH